MNAPGQVLSQRALARLRLSASQIQTFRDCQRKWSWKYVAGVETPSGPAAELGGKVHAELEKYLLGGSIDFTSEVGYIAASGLEHLPKPGTPGMHVEEEFHFYGPSGHSYLGYKDVTLEPNPKEQTAGVVIDHKTTSDFKWQKTTDDLKDDIQATLYAVDYFRGHPTEGEVDLKWVYYLTRNTRKSAVTHLRVHQESTWQKFLDIEQTAEEMAIAATKQPLELPPTIEHCSAYGGCPHQGRCNVGFRDKMRSHMANKLLAELAAKKNGAAPAGSVNGAPPPASPGAAAAPPASPVANKLLQNLKSRGAPTATSIAPLAAVPPAGPAINPPESELPEAVSGTIPMPEWASAVVDPRAPQQRVAPGEAIPNPYQLLPGGVAPPPGVEPGATAPAAAVAAPAPAAPAAAKLGRPKKEKLDMARFVALYPGKDPSTVTSEQIPVLNAHMLVAMPPAAPAVPPAAPAVPPAAPVVPPAASVAAASVAPVAPAAPAAVAAPTTHKIGVLYVNCGPVNCQVVDANVFIQVAKQKIAAQGIADYRFADFGKGAGMLAVATAAALDASPSQQHVRLDTTTPEGSIVSFELVARAALVVR